MSSSTDQPKALLEQDLIVSGKRRRRTVNRLVMSVESDSKQRYEETIHKAGRGSSLGNIRKLADVFRSIDFTSLKLLHKLIYGKSVPLGSPSELRTNLRAFSGLTFDQSNADEMSHLRRRLDKFSWEDVKRVASLLCLAPSDSRKELSVAIIDFLLIPEDEKCVGDKPRMKQSGAESDDAEEEEEEADGKGGSRRKRRRGKRAAKVARKGRKVAIEHAEMSSSVSGETPVVSTEVELQQQPSIAEPAAEEEEDEGKNSDEHLAKDEQEEDLKNETAAEQSHEDVERSEQKVVSGPEEEEGRCRDVAALEEARANEVDENEGDDVIMLVDVDDQSESREKEEEEGDH